MAIYAEEEEVWKCPKHPSKRRRNGICPVCLRDRLVALCPYCGNLRPCACCSATSSSSSASSSSSFSFFSSGGRVSDLIDSEPAFRRSRSVGIPFLFSRFAGEKGSDQREDSPRHFKRKNPWFWMNKSKKSEEDEQSKGNFVNKLDNHDGLVCRFNNSSTTSIEDFARMMVRSKSVHVGMMTSSDVRSSANGKGWSFPSPMKIFRHSSKTSKVVHDRSPLCRG